MISLIKRWKDRHINVPREEQIIDEQLFQDLIDFSGLHKEYIKKHLNRDKNCTYTYEYTVRNPKDCSELEWFYITSEKYLFANIIHSTWQLIDKIRGNKILDYGGGAGIDTFYLAKKGYNVHYFDISIIQREFVKFRVLKHSIKNVQVIDPYFENRFNPIRCITDTYDGILTRSLFEHVPYHVKLAKYLILRLNYDGILYEASKFGSSENDPMHVDETEPLENIIKEHGLELIYKDGVHRCWKKVV